MTLDSSAIQEIVSIAQDADQGEALSAGSIYAFRLGDTLKLVDLTTDEYRDAPRRKVGTTVVRDVPSFLAYFHKHGDDASEVYADRKAATITAVLDANKPDAPRFGQHRLVLRLTYTAAFQAWVGVDRQYMSQTKFSEHIEDRRPDIRTPDAATMLELAQTFQATTKVSFRSSQVLKSGQRQLQYVEETNASAGSKGDLVIPDALELAIAVFEGADAADAVTARLRYRIDSEGRLSLALILDRLDEVVDTAFEGVVAGVEAGVTVPVLRGTPA